MMIEIKDSNADYGIMFPNSIKDVRIEDLQKLVANVIIPKHYAIIALAFVTTPMTCAISVNSDKAEAVSVTPLLVRMSEEDKNDLAAVEGQKVITVRTEIERAIHLHVDTMLTADNFGNYLNNHKDLRLELINGKNEYAHSNIVLLEFKIMPINSVYGTVDLNKEITDPYLITEDTKFESE